MGRSWNEIWHCLFDEFFASKSPGQMLPGTKTFHERVAQYHSELCYGRVEQVQLSPGPVSSTSSAKLMDMIPLQARVKNLDVLLRYPSIHAAVAIIIMTHKPITSTPETISDISVISEAKTGTHGSVALGAVHSFHIHFCTIPPPFCVVTFAFSESATWVEDW